MMTTASNPSPAPRRTLRVALTIVSVALAAAVYIFWSRTEVAAKSQERIQVVDENTLAFPARVDRDGFENGDMAGYHAVVWKDGRAGHDALFQALVRDVDVLDAFEALGNRPGNGLTHASWAKRNDPDHEAPKRVLTGPPVEILIRLRPDAEPVPLADLLEDPGGRGLDLHFGGHRDLIPKWRSGCVVCLYSCPGSKVGNATYTIRDFVDGTTRFRVKEGVLPEDGTLVEVLLRRRT